MNCYFKYFNEVNKLSNYIKEENNYVNYDNLLLDFIYENRYLKLARIIFPLVKDKSLLTRFIIFINTNKCLETEWIEVIFNNGFSNNEENKIDISSFDNKLLKYSAKNGLIEIVKCLVENSANVHVEDDIVLKWASYYGHLEVVKYLVENGVDIHINNDFPIRYASYHGYLNLVRYLAENGADIHINNDEPLRLTNHLDVVKFLVENGAETALAPRDQRSHIHAHDENALICASSRGNLEVVKFFVENGADIHAEDNEALKWAIRNGHSKIVEYLKLKM